jgi:4-amino-4-deoxy-L-arabinose transferase-like glycosyltransferase
MRCVGERRLGWWGIALVVLLVAVGGGASIWSEPPNDETLWLCATRAWLRGDDTPYEASFDTKPIMVYLGYRVALNTPVGGVVGVRLVGLLVTALTAAALAYGVASQWGQAAGLSAGLAYALCWALLGPHGLMTEDLQAFFTVLAVLLWYSAVRRSADLLFLAAGLVWGLAVISKQPALLSLTAFVGLTVLSGSRETRLRERVRHGLVLSAGAAVAPLFFIGWLANVGGPEVLNEWIAASLPFSGTNAALAELGMRAKGAVKILIVFSALAPVLFCVVWGVLTRRSDRKLQPLVVWALVEAIAYIFPGTGFEHQLVPFAAPAAALCGIGVAALLDRVGDTRAMAWALGATVALLYAGPILTSLGRPQQSDSPILGLKRTVGIRTGLASPSQREAIGRWAGSATSPGDVVFGPSYVLWYAERESAFPYYAQPLDRDTSLCARWRRVLAQDLARRPPELVVVERHGLTQYPGLADFVERRCRRVGLPSGLADRWQAHRRVR